MESWVENWIFPEYFTSEAYHSGTDEQINANGLKYFNSVLDSLLFIHWKWTQSFSQMAGPAKFLFKHKKGKWWLKNDTEPFLFWISGKFLTHRLFKSTL